MLSLGYGGFIYARDPDNKFPAHIKHLRGDNSDRYASNITLRETKNTYHKQHLRTNKRNFTHNKKKQHILLNIKFFTNKKLNESGLNLM